MFNTNNSCSLSSSTSPTSSTFSTSSLPPAGFWPSPYSAKELGSSYKSLHSPFTTDKAHYWVVNEPGIGCRLYRRLHASFLQAELDQNDVFAPVDGRLTHGNLLPSDGVAHPLEFFTAPGQPLSIGTRVHEYGGWAWTIVAEEHGSQLGISTEIVASDALTGLLYHGRAGQIMKPLSTDPLLRFANPVYCPSHHSVIAVCEDHRPTEIRKSAMQNSDSFISSNSPSASFSADSLSGSSSPHTDKDLSNDDKTWQVENYLVEISLADPHKNTILARGQGFYNWPTLNADGTKLAFVGWDAKEMPWTTTKIWVAKMNSNQKIGLEPNTLKCVCDQGASAQPLWIKHAATHQQSATATHDSSNLEDQLIFVNDNHGFLNLYRLENIFISNPCSTDAIRRRCLHQRNAEFATPAWNIGIRNYAQLDYEHLAVSYVENGVWSFGTLNIATAFLEKLQVDNWEPNPYGLTAGNGRILALANNLSANSALVELANGQLNVLDQSNPTNPDPDFVSVGQAICWPTANSLAEVALPTVDNSGSNFSQSDLRSHGFYYAPQLAFSAEIPSLPDPKSESVLPCPAPLIVMVHGGPTSQYTRGYDPQVQFWTSRGFAILQVNHRGSTGYGRAYQDALNGQWGVYDVIDCVSGAAHLCRQGLADPQKIFIRGGSAGGFTTLAALVSTQVFSGGCSRYGIADLEKLVATTHKFEAAYNDFLIGLYPQEQELYQQRSPITNIAGLKTPLLILQGEEDKVVPPSQAKLMADAAQAQGVPVDVHIYKEEGHGFRKSENIADAFKRELNFYQQILNSQINS